MDYLVRDSHYAGVSLGMIDLFYLINTTKIIKHAPKMPYTLGIMSKGVKTYEAYILARHLMNRSIYYHKKIKVIETMIENVFTYFVNEYKYLCKNLTIKRLIPSYISYLRKLSALKTL
jgi:hypothetical protein